VDPTELPRTVLMTFYRSVVSPVAGTRCSMYPSCSRYMEGAIRKRGVIVGILLGCDRLLRCGNDLHFYDIVVKDGSAFRQDPVGDSHRPSR
jgi:putative component of membrane protein insertase Oxa1/YidC/SpoIIIJ protein YidD